MLCWRYITLLGHWSLLGSYVALPKIFTLCPETSVPSCHPPRYATALSRSCCCNFTVLHRWVFGLTTVMFYCHWPSTTKSVSTFYQSWHIWIFIDIVGNYWCVRYVTISWTQCVQQYILYVRRQLGMTFHDMPLRCLRVSVRHCSQYNALWKLPLFLAHSHLLPLLGVNYFECAINLI